jgi:G patch domain-containing protein 1
VHRFPLPDVPTGWKPDPRRVWQNDKSDKENSIADVPPASSTSSSWRNNLSADQRGNALGETPISSKPRSVFEYMSQKDRDRLRNVIPQAKLPSDTSMQPPPLPPPSDSSPFTSAFKYPRIEPQVAKAALSGFKPFSTDPVKQTRYTAYLQSQSQAHNVTSDSGDHKQLKQMPDQDLEHFQKELEEYAQAAIVFKPLSGAMAGRFTTAAVVDHGPNVIEGLHTPSQIPEPEVSVAVEKKEEDAKTHAVRMGMFGSMTREISLWVPAKLLCKRFGVKEPEVEQSAEDPAAAGTSARTWEPEVDPAMAEAELINVSATASFFTKDPNSRNRRDVANIGMGEDETQGTDILTYERPGRDIFKAIFASDDEDSDDDEGGKQGTHEDEDLGPTMDLVPATITKPPAATNEVVDLASFKPIFVPRSEREGDQGSAFSKKRKKDKDKEKKKKGGKVLVSFEVEEADGAEFTPAAPQERSRKKRKSKHVEKEDEDDGMWIEKPVPKVVQALGVNPEKHDETKTQGGVRPSLKARKQAVDFM